jgi:hypothetical protein
MNSPIDKAFGQQMFVARMERKPRPLTQQGLRRLLVKEFGESATSLRTIERIEAFETPGSNRSRYQIRKVLGL